jgi:hypothetical protein
MAIMIVETFVRLLVPSNQPVLAAAVHLVVVLVGEVGLVISEILQSA